MNYNIGFWNYRKLNNINVKEEVKQWKELGFNRVLSFKYISAESKKQEMMTLLDECGKNGIKVIVYDDRTLYNTLQKVGEKKFKEGVKDAVADFGNHPAVFGFYVGDEPNAESWDYAEKAYIIVRNACLGLVPYINFFPYFLDESFPQVLGCHRDEYANKLDHFMQKTDAKILSYDFYGQCSYFEEEKWIDCYFKNLNLFGRIARKNGAELCNSLLSIGHWLYRCPTADDIRWQISTSVAHGVEGIMWFYIYQQHFYQNYRKAPVDLFGNKNPIFYDIAFEDRVLLEFYADLLKDCKFKKVEHWLNAYGDTPLFKGDGALKEIKPVVNPTPLAITFWETSDFEPVIGIVNLSQTMPTAFIPTFNGDFAKYNGLLRLSPGQLVVFTKNKVCPEQ